MACQEKSGKQLGEPAKLAEAVLALIASDNPTPQLLPGRDALGLVSNRIERLQQEIET